MANVVGYHAAERAAITFGNVIHGSSRGDSHKCEEGEFDHVETSVGATSDKRRSSTSDFSKENKRRYLEDLQVPVPVPYWKYRL